MDARRAAEGAEPQPTPDLPAGAGLAQAPAPDKAGRPPSDLERARVIPVVGIGASAGGLEAFRAFVGVMPPNAGVAFVLVQHLDPTHESLLAETLRPYTTMAVSQVEDRTTVETDHVYVIPPNRYLSIRDGVLHLTTPSERPGLRTPIDFFLRSLAEDQHERAIGILLSGSGHDGSLGLRAIKGNGGMAMVQLPESAQHDGMLQSAIETGIVDYVLEVESMPDVLIKYLRHSYVRLALTRETPSPPPSDDLNTILTLLRDQTQHDFHNYKRNMVARRIERRMGLNQIDELSDYVAFLRSTPGEVRRLFKDLLIGVTNFFRETDALRLLEEEVIPELVAAHTVDAPLRIWVPACATGEEAYSIGMLFLERISATPSAASLQIYATDIDEESLEFARAARYPDTIASDVSPDRLRRFFNRESNLYRVKQHLRETVTFATQNLIAHPPFSKLDLISCRNLLIYFEPDLQRRIMLLFHFALNEGGYLLLGGSETVAQDHDLFERVSSRNQVYRRVPAPRTRQGTFPILSGDHGQRSAGRRPAATGSDKLSNIAQQLLLKEYAPAAVLINRRHEILYFHGPVDRYLDIPGGQPTTDLMAMAREGLRSKLRAAVQDAIREKGPVRVARVLVRRHDSRHRVHITVTPVKMPMETDRLLLVTFDDEAAVFTPVSPATDQAPADDTLARQLEHELESTKEDLYSTIQELEIANEELQVSNEEVMSMNEELRSANEELETSKEELQSVNEELRTVNTQLLEKMRELEATSNDLANLLSSTEIATIFLDVNLCIKRFTPATTALLNLIPTDLGRPITDISSKLIDQDLAQDAATVLETLLPIEREVETVDSRWFVRRTLPYRTDQNRIEGVVITLVDVSATKRAEMALRDSQEQLLLMADALPAYISYIDRDERYQFANAAYERTLGISRDALRGRQVRQVLGDHLYERIAARIRIVLAGQQISFEQEIALPDGEHRQYHVLGVPHIGPDDRVAGFYALATDISDLKRAEADSRNQQAELARVLRVATMGELTAEMAHELNQPLCAVVTSAHAAQRLMAGDEPRRDEVLPVLADIVAAGERAAAIIKNLKEILRKNKPEPTVLHINEVLNEILRWVEIEARQRNATVHLDLADNLPRFLGDPVQIQQVLLNLILNGFESMAGSESASHELIIGTALGETGVIEITVRDCGTGLPGEVADRIFDPFFTTKVGGIGMGLPISRSIVKAHGGRLWASANPRGGSTFRFTLPAFSKEATT